MLLFRPWGQEAGNTFRLHHLKQNTIVQSLCIIQPLANLFTFWCFTKLDNISSNPNVFAWSHLLLCFLDVYGLIRTLFGFKLLLFLMGKGDCAVHHKGTQVEPLKLTFQFQLIYAAYHRRTLKLCRLGDAGELWKCNLSKELTALS